MAGKRKKPPAEPAPVRFIRLLTEELDGLEPLPDDLARASLEMVAMALVDEPSNASLWRQFNEQLTALRGEVAEDEDEISKALAGM